MNVCVELLNISDVRGQAWRVSRPYMPQEEVVDMSVLDKTDFSLQMLKQVTLSCRTSAYFRELLTTVRPYAMWSQSSRVNKLEETEAPDYLSFEQQLAFYNEISKLSKQLIREEDKSAQDRIRLGLPISHLSSYVYQTDIRTLVCFLKSLREKDQYHFGIYGQLIMDAAGIDDLDSYRFPPLYSGDQPFDDSCKSLGRGYYAEVGPVVVVSEDISISLRAQLARHTGINLRDSYFWGPDSQEKQLDPLSLNIRAVLTTDKHMWSKVLRHRSCWIAHWELGYEPFITSYLDTTSQSLKDILPCSGQQSLCSCSPDVQARIAGNDPGIPCPIWTKRLSDVRRRIASLGESDITDMYAEVL